MATTIVDVARRARVSTTTVSNYLNGHYANMSPETRNRIKEVIEKTDYSPRIVAQSLPKKREAKTIAIVIPRNLDYIFGHSYFREVVRGIDIVLNRTGYRSILISKERRSPADLRYLRSLSHGIVDGFLFFDIRAREPYLAAFRNSGIPVVGVGYDEEALDICVDDDVVGGVKAALNHLMSLGHRKIGLISGPRDMVFSQQMISGYRSLLESKGISYDPNFTRHSPFRTQAAFRIAHRLLQKHPTLTAILTGSGEIARACIEAAFQLHRTIPGQLSLVSFGEKVYDHRIGGFTTYVRQHIEEVGIRVTEKLLQQIRGEYNSLGFDQLPTELIPGASSAPPDPNDAPSQPTVSL